MRKTSLLLACGGLYDHVVSGHWHARLHLVKLGTMALDAGEILETIDHFSGVLPALANDGRQHLTDARLTVFRSSERWAVFFEFINVMDVQFHNWITGVGNCFMGDISWADELNQRSLFEEVEASRLWSNKSVWIGDKAGFSIQLQGQRLDFNPTPEDYAAAGILFKNRRTGPGSIEPGHLLRFLCYHLNHPFFASEAELRNLFQDGSESRILLQTPNWHHPVYLVDSWEESLAPDDRYRENACFQILSRAIATGDLVEWNTQDSTSFNTHWKRLEAIRQEHF